MAVILVLLTSFQEFQEAKYSSISLYIKICPSLIVCAAFILVFQGRNTLILLGGKHRHDMHSNLWNDWRITIWSYVCFMPEKLARRALLRYQCSYWLLIGYLIVAMVLLPTYYKLNPQSFTLIYKTIVMYTKLAHSFYSIPNIGIYVALILVINCFTNILLPEGFSIAIGNINYCFILLKVV